MSLGQLYKDYLMMILKLFLLIFLFPTSGFANDEDLYDPKVNNKKAYIRIYNNIDDEQKPSLNGYKYPQLSKQSLSPYYPQNISKIKIQPDFSYDVEKGGFYSVILDEPVWVIEDTRPENKAKAIIAFYNLSNKDNLNLVANNSFPIFEDIEKRSGVDREINAAKINLAVIIEGEVLSQLNDVILERNNHYTVIYDGKGIQFITATIDHQN